MYDIIPNVDPFLFVSMNVDSFRNFLKEHTFNFPNAQFITF